jgi:hypothetical protein
MCGCWLDSAGSGWGIISLEHDTELSGSLEVVEFDYLSYCQILKARLCRMGLAGWFIG